MTATRTALALLLLASSWLARPAAALEVPPLAGRVNDLAGVVPEEDEARIERRLVEYEQRTGHQVAVLLIPSLEGDPIEDFSIRVVERWQLGTEGRDDGMLLLLAVNDRQARIEVGYGLEGAVPDVVASRVIRDQMAPHLRQGDYAGAISSALDVLLPTAAGESVGPAPGAPVARDQGIPSLFFVLLVVFLVGGVLWALPRPVRAVLTGGLGGALGLLFFGSLLVALVTGGLGLLLGLLLPRGGRRRRGPPLWFPFGGFPRHGRGPSGRGFGGGGFSGGGGGFGGGGASGRW